MKTFMKKLVALALAAVMAMTVLTGCAGNSVNDSDVAATVGDAEITAGLLNFYVRFQQSSVDTTYSTYYGNNIWNQEIAEGETYGENLVNSALELLEQLYVLENHMADYKVVLTDTDMEAIDAAAEAFIADNKSSVLDKISGTKENVAEILRLFAISDKMYDAIIAEADTDVKEEDVALKEMSYVFFSKTKEADDEDGGLVELEGEELDKVYVQAKAFLAGAKAEGSLLDYAEAEDIEATTINFNADTTTIAEDVIKAADQLKQGEFTEIIETEYYFFVAQLDSEYDEEATKTALEEKIAEIESEHYSEVVEKWVDETEVVEHKDVLKQVNVGSLKITAKEEEEDHEGHDHE